jgi:NAD(P)H-hydrate epimerase
MRGIESTAVAEFGVRVSEMMEAAGKALAEEISQTKNIQNVLAAAGPGNNGGDGIAAARFLHAEGKNATILLAVEPAKLKDEPLHQFRMAAEAGVPIIEPSSPQFRAELQRFGEFDAIIDALLGTGARLPVEGLIRQIIEAINDSSALIVSADIPTGIDCDTGRAFGEHVFADRTLTFGLAKPFLFCADGIAASGAWRIVDIGLPFELYENAGTAFLIEDTWAFTRLPRRNVHSHKRSSGVVLVIAGSRSFPGAASLTARGAYRAGAGLVLVATVEEAAQSVRATMPESPVEVVPSKDGFLCSEAIGSVIAMAERCDAVVIGPGIGREPCVGRFVDGLFARLEAQWVVDADALWWLPEIRSHPSKPALLTPHNGEAARLLGCDHESVAGARFSAIREITEKYSHQTLLKGPHSLVCEADGEIGVNMTGSPQLATAGTGDVLAGVAGAYLAVLGDPFLAGALAAFVHGAAGELLDGEHPGMMGALATEIADAIPKARKERFDRLVEAMESLEEDDEQWDEDYEEDDLDERLN